MGVRSNKFYIFDIKLRIEIKEFILTMNTVIKI